MIRLLSSLTCRRITALVAVTAACLLLSPVLFSGNDAEAWTPTTHCQIAGDALRLSPKYLRIIIGKYPDQLLRGALGPRDKDAFQFRGTSGNFQDTAIPELIESQVKAIEKLMRKPGNLAEVAYRFGLISHYVSLVGNPLNVRNTDEHERYYHTLFDAYVEKELKNFRVAFTGFNKELFGSLELRDYLRQSAVRPGRFYKPLAVAFVKGERIASINTFNHQSVPFAVASLSYGHAVTTVADVWQALWRSVGGSGTMDISAVPLEKESTHRR